jgi:hypothetical protein
MVGSLPAVFYRSWNNDPYRFHGRIQIYLLKIGKASDGLKGFSF